MYMDNIYKNKYLKYKTKYNQLLEKISIIGAGTKGKAKKERERAIKKAAAEAREQEAREQARQQAEAIEKEEYIQKIENSYDPMYFNFEKEEKYNNHITIKFGEKLKDNFWRDFTFSYMKKFAEGKITTSEELQEFNEKYFKQFYLHLMLNNAESRKEYKETEELVLDEIIDKNFLTKDKLNEIDEKYFNERWKIITQKKN